MIIDLWIVKLCGVILSAYTTWKIRAMYWEANRPADGPAAHNKIPTYVALPDWWVHILLKTKTLDIEQKRQLDFNDKEKIHDNEKTIGKTVKIMTANVTAITYVRIAAIRHFRIR